MEPSTFKVSVFTFGISKETVFPITMKKDNERMIICKKNIQPWDNLTREWQYAWHQLLKRLDVKINQL